ncbi:MAG: cupin domain-containing protein [Candidatus Latescibacteria bacterium]|nr:cupin domain-containing protein [Candidatus Latescibacterota bacterium]
MSRAIVCNWRDVNPYVGHINALVWHIFKPTDADSDDPAACLHHMGGIARHAMQAGKESDSHNHPNAEQYYYILKGTGEVLVGDKLHPVRPGMAIYFAPGVQHQFFAGSEDEWCEHLIITCSVDRTQSQPRLIHWDQVTPESGKHGAAVTWLMLESLDEPEPESDQPCLLGFYYLARQALVRGKASDCHQHDDKEQVYYITEGYGTVVIGDDVYKVREGDSIYIPKGALHQIFNDACDGWLAYLVIS